LTSAKPVLLTAIAALLLAAQPAWREISADGRKAYEAGDYATYRKHLQALLGPLSGHPTVIFGLVKAEALLGHPKESIRWLKTYSSLGLYQDLASVKDLASIRDDPDYKALAAQIAHQNQPLNRSRVWIRFDDIRLIPEDITYDAAHHRFFVTSIGRRKIVAVEESGRVSDWIPDGRDGNWSFLAVAASPAHKILWATMEALPHAASGYRDEDKGKSALLAFDLESGALRKRFDIGGGGSDTQMGDMAVAPDGVAYVSDGGKGIMYRAAVDSALLETLPLGLTSPQGPAFAAGGKRLYLSDYAEGLFVVDPFARQARKLGWKLRIAVNGIDGLTWEGPRSLIGVQNGNEPKRIVRYRLDPSGTAVSSAEVLEAIPERMGEPTHGVIVGSRYYFLSNTGLAQFDESGKLPPNAALTPPEIRALQLR
jgi:hypothetical protein